MDYLFGILAAACLLLIVRKTTAGNPPPDFNELFHCEVQSNAAPWEVQRVQRGDLPQSELGKCYVKCLLEMLGMIDQIGRISDKAIDLLFEEHSMEPKWVNDENKERMHLCAIQANQELSTCHKGYMMLKCVTTLPA